MKISKQIKHNCEIDDYGTVPVVAWTGSAAIPIGSHPHIDARHRASSDRYTVYISRDQAIIANLYHVIVGMCWFKSHTSLLHCQHNHDITLRGDLRSVNWSLESVTSAASVYHAIALTYFYLSLDYTVFVTTLRSLLFPREFRLCHLHDNHGNHHPRLFAISGLGCFRLLQVPAAPG
jgi:hypothetical protein